MSVHDGTEDASPHMFHCRLCRTHGVHYVDPVAWCRWRDGALIQDVWPWMSADDREALRLDLHTHCLDTYYGGDAA